jgi:hypothetical protein
MCLILDVTSISGARSYLSDCIQQVEHIDILLFSLVLSLIIFIIAVKFKDGRLGTISHWSSGALWSLVFATYQGRRRGDKDYTNSPKQYYLRISCKKADGTTFVEGFDSNRANMELILQVLTASASLDLIQRHGIRQGAHSSADQIKSLELSISRF